jgi:hypothetical protein
MESLRCLLPRKLMLMPCCLSLIIFHAVVQGKLLPRLSRPLCSLSFSLIPDHPECPIKSLFEINEACSMIIKILQVPVITLICTIHAYLASGHLRFLLCQSTAEQLFLKTLFIKAHVPCSITACVYMLADPKQPACTYKSTKKGKLRRNTQLWVS